MIWNKSRVSYKETTLKKSELLYIYHHSTYVAQLFPYGSSLRRNEYWWIPDRISTSQKSSSFSSLIIFTCSPTRGPFTTMAQSPTFGVVVCSSSYASQNHHKPTWSILITMLLFITFTFAVNSSNRSTISPFFLNTLRSTASSSPTRHFPASR